MYLLIYGCPKTCLKMFTSWCVDSFIVLYSGALTSSPHPSTPRSKISSQVFTFYEKKTIFLLFMINISILFCNIRNPKSKTSC